MIIDDSESVLEQKTGKELLRSLCETDENKTLSWDTTAIDKYDVPPRFTTRSKVCIICNRWVDTDSLTGAIADRAHMYAFRPTGIEIHNYTAQWFDDAEILEWFGERVKMVDRPSARHYVKTRQQKNAGGDWRAYAERHFLFDALRQRIMEIEGLPGTRREKENMIVKAGLCSRATYYRFVAQLQEEGQM